MVVSFSAQATGQRRRTLVLHPCDATPVCMRGLSRVVQQFEQNFAQTGRIDPQRRQLGLEINLRRHPGFGEGCRQSGLHKSQTVAEVERLHWGLAHHPVMLTRFPSLVTSAADS